MRKHKVVLRLTLSAAILSLSGCMVIGGGSKAAAPDLCAALPEPKPFAKQVNLEIVEGDLLHADAGGEQLIREYTGAIAAHRAACGK